MNGFAGALIGPILGFLISTTNGGLFSVDSIVPEAQSPLPNSIEQESMVSASLQSFFFRKKPENDFEETSKRTKDALVNIICIPKSGTLQAISGSGVIVSSRGIILTNAHIGQYFLFQQSTGKDSTSCIIRTGNPAEAAFGASLIYISPKWVSANAKMILSNNPVGTGENDYALLLINVSLSPTHPLPSSFPFIPINPDKIDTDGEEVLVAGYPAGVLGGIELSRDLYAVSAVVKVNEIESFDGIQRDFLLLSHSSVGQKGSSGGAVVDPNNTLISLLVSAPDSGVGFEGELGSITLAHINRSIKEDTSLTLAEYLAKDPQAAATVFKIQTVPTFLKKINETFLPCPMSSKPVFCSMNGQR